MHGVGGLEAERGPARAAERLIELLDDLVGPVGRPGLLGRHAVAQIGGQIVAQYHGVPVGIPVQHRGFGSSRLSDVPDERVRRAEGVLVGVQADPRGDLRRTVGRAAEQVVPQRRRRPGGDTGAACRA